jgi:hypothetical protein
VHQQRGVQLNRSSPQAVVARVIQRDFFFCLFVHVYVAAYLKALEAEGAHAARHFLYRCFRIVHGESSDADETRGVFGDLSSHVVVEILAHREAIARPRPVAEHHRHGGQHLHVDAEFVHVVFARVDVPHVPINFPEKLAAVVYHVGLALRVLVPLQPDEASVPKLRLPLRELLRQDVRVHVDTQAIVRHFREGLKSAFGAGDFFALAAAAAEQRCNTQSKAKGASGCVARPTVAAPRKPVHLEPMSGSTRSRPGTILNIKFNTSLLF